MKDIVFNLVNYFNKMNEIIGSNDFTCGSEIDENYYVTLQKKGDDVIYNLLYKNKTVNEVYLSLDKFHSLNSIEIVEEFTFYTDVEVIGNRLFVCDKEVDADRYSANYAWVGEHIKDVPHEYFKLYRRGQISFEELVLLNLMGWG